MTATDRTNDPRLPWPDGDPMYEQALRFAKTLLQQPPTWTKTRPTTPGWYWFKPKGTPTIGGQTVMYLTESGKWFWGSQRCPEDLLALEDALYAGPLHPPELPKPEAP